MIWLFFQAYERMNLADALVPMHFADNERIIRQGDTADGMYFVEDGIVRITILGENGREVEVSWTFFRVDKNKIKHISSIHLTLSIESKFSCVEQINRVPAGGYLGELALVTHKPRAASAYAVGNVKLACEY